MVSASGHFTEHLGDARWGRNWSRSKSLHRRGSRNLGETGRKSSMKIPGDQSLWSASCFSTMKWVFHENQGSFHSDHMFLMVIYNASEKHTYNTSPGIHEVHLSRHSVSRRQVQKSLLPEGKGLRGKKTGFPAVMCMVVLQYMRTIYVNHMCMSIGSKTSQNMFRMNLSHLQHIRTNHRSRCPQL